MGQQVMSVYIVMHHLEFLRLPLMEQNLEKPDTSGERRYFRESERICYSFRYVSPVLHLDEMDVTEHHKPRAKLRNNSFHISTHSL